MLQHEQFARRFEIGRSDRRSYFQENLALFEVHENSTCEFCMHVENVAEHFRDSKKKMMISRSK